MQKLGCAMGTTCAFNNANLFLKTYVHPSIHPSIEITSTFYFRFIDDLFLCWSNSENELLEIFGKLNLKDPSIKFAFKCLYDKITF